MPTGSKIRALLWPTIATAIALIAILSLGTWQMQRKEWKDDLLADIEARATRAPINMADPKQIDQLLEQGAPQYTNVSVSGEFSHEFERYLYAPDPKLGPGYQVFTPLHVSQTQVIWVNRGYIPQRLKAPSTRRDGLPKGTITVTGLVRPPAPKDTFSPDNDVNKNAWYWRDLKAMHESAYDPAKVHAYPFFIDAQRQPKPSNTDASAAKWPKGGVTLLKLPNRHLEYALTWYGLAFALLAVYGVFIRARLSTPNPPAKTKS